MLLACLLLHANEVVSRDHLIDALNVGVRKTAQSCFVSSEKGYPQPDLWS